MEGNKRCVEESEGVEVNKVVCGGNRGKAEVGIQLRRGKGKVGIMVSWKGPSVRCNRTRR